MIITLRTIVIIILLVAFGAGNIFPNDDDDIKSKQVELDRLRKEIQEYEDRIK